MLSLGVVICEILGDPKWTERLRNREKEYTTAKNTPGLDKETSRKLLLMRDRARYLGNKNSWAEADKSPLTEERKKANSGYYRDATYKLYPNRLIKRMQKEAGENPIAKAQADKVSYAKSLLPKSLQK